jgi:hypothetical protein
MSEQHKPGETVKTSSIYKVVKEGDGSSGKSQSACSKMLLTSMVRSDSSEPDPKSRPRFNMR